VQWIIKSVRKHHVDIKRVKGSTETARGALQTIHEDEDETASIIYSEPALSAALKVPPKTVEGKISKGALSRSLSTSLLLPRMRTHTHTCPSR